MNNDEIIIEDINGLEKQYTLYDKILYESQNIYVYLNEERYGEIELVFLKYDQIHHELSDDLYNYNDLVLFYKNLNLLEEN